MQLQPYLFFNGRSEEAIEFYKKAVGAKVNRIMRFKESPDQSMVDPKTIEKVMHADINVGGTNVLLSDGRCQGDLKFEGFALTIYAKDDAEAQTLFKSLSDGGQVQMPLTKTFFASSFGMVADRFGLGWMILAGPK
jgi:PhnB protein